MEENADPTSLVCDECWDSLFSRDEYRAICQSVDERAIYAGHPYTIPFQASEDLTVPACSWCNFILSKARRNIKPVPLQGEPLTIDFSSFTPRRTSSPAGKNTATAFVNGNPLFGNIFVKEDSVARDVVTAREIQTNLSSERASKQILDWLIDCDEHATCPSLMPSILPTRVIDVGLGNLLDVPKLVETKGTTGYYVALSYCWGLDQIGLTTISNRETRMSQLDLGTLSQTSRDAITVTKSLGIRYLWIDAICIVQDSPDDKVIELSSMCRIYQQATFTIVAASATSASQGFLEDREPLEPAVQIPFWAPDDTLTSVYLRAEQLYDDDEEPINSRAWTLQEQLLSPRRLVYASHTLQYQCREHTLNLGNSIHTPAQLESRNYLVTLEGVAEEIRDQEIGRAWVDIIRMYSQRRLSFQEDKLTALGGIAEAFSSHKPGDYIAGLWSGEVLARLLLWVITPKGYAASPIYVAPSWSWASLDCPVLFHYFHHKHTFKLYHVDIKSYNVVLDNAALPFGRIRSGELTIEAYARSGRFDKPQVFRWSSRSSSSASCVNQEMSARLDDPDTQQGELKCLAIARRTFEGGNIQFTPVIDGLLISMIENSSRYRRVGTFLGLHENKFLGFTKETLTLV
ncbi:hypothetical protein VTL71DRAFT_15525 [Oculimacula yallundae]|uniref:Heterokaryon incompatibility domain-containing protein n=1 Tax=Oculimacula yallundae TaxID=86028 RepID=A0ABR4CGU5_9HELO